MNVRRLLSVLHFLLCYLAGNGGNHPALHNLSCRGSTVCALAMQKKALRSARSTLHSDKIVWYNKDSNFHRENP